MDNDKIVPIADKIRNGDDSDKLSPGSAPPDPEKSADKGVGKADETTYPASSPVQPLGTKEGEFHFLDARGSHRILTANKFDGAHIEDIFSPRTPLLATYWPHFNKEGILTGWSQKKARPSLMNACARQGQFDPSKKLRGLGAWIDDDGVMIYHGGTHLFRAGKKVKPGFVGGYLYPHRAAGIQPGNAAEAGSACQLLTDIIGTWNFERGADATRLVLGHIITQLVCGALDFRPAIYLTGDEGSGKTTLLKLMEAVAGMLMAGDASAAGIYQTIGSNALPVGLDETEPDMPLPKQKAMLALMRSAASGNTILRGTGEHRSISFNARSSFVFGSITPLQMSRADLSRMPMIEIGPITGKLPDYTDKELAAAGSAILARMIENWPAFLARFDLWADALRKANCDPRAIDTYGTLLAAADFASHTEPPDPLDMAEDAARFSVTSLDETGNVRQGQLCLETILGHRAQLDGEARRIEIFEIIRRLCEDTADENDDYNAQIEIGEKKKRLDRTLRQHGLAVFSAIKDDAGPRDMLPLLNTHRAHRKGHWLAIAHRHTGLIETFKDTPWQTEASSAMSGWTPTLKRLVEAPFHAAPSASPIRFSGSQKRATLIRIDHLLGED